jgi:hypothetical protein
MKTSTLLFALLLPALSFAAIEKKMDALVRSESNRPIVDEVTLTDLISQESFDGEHFKIVKGKEEAAIRFDADEELSFRAATAYYHLTKARNYFVNVVKSDYVAQMPKITVRIDHKNQFSELGHFANDNMEPQFNNALTIPAGRGLESKGVKPWGTEIWFRPSKHVNIHDLRVDDTQYFEFKILMSQYREQTHMQSLQRFFTNLAFSVSNDGNMAGAFTQDALVRTVGSSVLMEAAYLLFDPINKVFQRKWYWLDTALIPEIIYHEYSHAALSDYLVLSHSTPIIEGMADFFAGQIADSPKLAMKIKQYNTYNGKNAKKKQQYMIQFETEEYANTDFVFGLLWQMKTIVGEEKGTQFMFDLRKKLTTNSSIRKELVEGILQTCEESCESPFVDKLRIMKALNLKGI